jgi:hypothetical protein
MKRTLFSLVFLVTLAMSQSALAVPKGVDPTLNFVARSFRVIVRDNSATIYNEKDMAIIPITDSLSRGCVAEAVKAQAEGAEFTISGYAEDLPPTAQGKGYLFTEVLSCNIDLPSTGPIGPVAQ